MRKIPQVGLSMAPLILPTDKVFVEKVKNPKLNDVVVFKKGGQLIAHRIIYIKGGKIVTKGDHNKKSDGVVRASSLLGKVEKIKREGETITLRSIYLTQSSHYLRELDLVNRQFHKKKLKYILLKGLPIHLFYEGGPPQRLYLDADILVARKDFAKTKISLEGLGFKDIKPELLGRPVRNFNQISFIKQTEPFPVVIDVHLEPAIAFTKATSLNKLLPRVASYTKHLFKSCQYIKVGSSPYPMLNREDQLLYLLLHFFHHNFQGTYRMELIRRVASKNLDYTYLVNTAEKYGFEHYIYPAVLITNKYFHGRILPEDFNVSFLAKNIARFVSRRNTPFDEDPKAIAGAKRFILVFVLSKASLFKKFEVFSSRDTFDYSFSIVKSFFFKR
jgi:signal peptidase I